jgi:hypothetical protein
MEGAQLNPSFGNLQADRIRQGELSSLAGDYRRDSMRNYDAVPAFLGQVENITDTDRGRNLFTRRDALDQTAARIPSSKKRLQCRPG